MGIGCVVRRVDLTEEVTLTAEQMELYGDSRDARKALRGPCVFVLYAESADALRVGSTRHVIKRWNTLDDGSPEPLHLIMVWRAPDMTSAGHQERYLHSLLAAFAIADRRNWYHAPEAARVLMSLTAWAPPADPVPEVSVRDLVEQVWGDRATTLQASLTERMFQRLEAWDSTRTGADLRRVHVTLAALRDAGADPDTVLEDASKVNDTEVRERVQEFTRVYRSIRG